LAQGLWQGHLLSWHINRLELMAVFRALTHLLPNLRGHHVLVRMNNTLVVSYINHQAVLQLHHLWKTGSPNPPVSPREAAFSKSSFISHEHQNHRADILSRQGLLWEKFGQAEVPVCISRDNTRSDVVLPYLSSSSRTGYHGTAMAKLAISLAYEFTYNISCWRQWLIFIVNGNHYCLLNEPLTLLAHNSPCTISAMYMNYSTNNTNWGDVWYYFYSPSNF